MVLRKALLLSVFVALVSCGLAVNAAVPTIAVSDTSVLSQDVTKPNIWAWGIDGHPELLEPFSVWANVTDDEDGSGIRNVTLVVTGPNATIRDVMVYNGTSELFEKDVSALPNDGVFRVALYAFDMENNSRSSYDAYITVSVGVEPPPDQSITLPYVVGGSLAVAALVFFVAYSYDKRRPASE
jgi:hypothetical protein